MRIVLIVGIIRARRAEETPEKDPVLRQNEEHGWSVTGNDRSVSPLSYLSCCYFMIQICNILSLSQFVIVSLSSFSFLLNIKYIYCFAVIQ